MKKTRCVLIPFICFLLLTIVPWSFAGEKKKYPTYPDVWGYELPWPGKENRFAAIDIAKLPEGDYMVTYVKNWYEKIDKYAGILFFSGEKRGLTINNYNVFWRIHHNNRVGGKQIILANGVTIDQTYIGTSAQCPDPFYDYYLTKKDRNGNILLRKMILYLYDKSQRSNINRYCERNISYKKDYILKKVDNVYVKFVLLEDDTFLIYDTNGNFIIRFDENFDTKSVLMNKNVFLINRLNYEQIYEKQSKEGEINDQVMNDVIANYLTNLKKEGGK